MCYLDEITCKVMHAWKCCYLALPINKLMVSWWSSYRKVIWMYRTMDNRYETKVSLCNLCVISFHILHGQKFYTIGLKNHGNCNSVWKQQKMLWIFTQEYFFVIWDCNKPFTPVMPSRKSIWLFEETTSSYVYSTAIIKQPHCWKYRAMYTSVVKTHC